MRTLLINPRFPESFWSSRWALNEILESKRAVSPPLGLATLAALCPPDWDVAIIDENIEPIPLAPEADIIGVCGMGVQFPRQQELIRYYRGRGYYVIAGGSFASLCPEQYEPLADSVIAGEVEYVFPEFCRDFERGQSKHLYQETGTVALSDSPTPRFDLLKLDQYAYASLQFSRGCPFRCEFCDIIVMFGRKPRVKSMAQIGRELDELRRFGVRNAFFVDDNLIGNLPVAKELLQYLKEYQEQHNYQFSFGTEASLNMALHNDLLARLRDAHFGWVFIGIESTDPASLKETLKTQNLKEDIMVSLRRIYAHGIEVLAGFIIGFDNDTMDAFEDQYQLITEAGIQAAMIGLLTALPKTPLHARLAREGRLNTFEHINDNTRPGTNVIPKNMAYDEMVAAYIELYRRLLQDREIAHRIRNKLQLLRESAYAGGYSTRESLGITWRLLRKGIIPGGPRRVWLFLSTLPIHRRALWSTVISDWITALSMREFAERKLAPQSPDPDFVNDSVGSLRTAMAPYLADSQIALTRRSGGDPHLAVHVREPRDGVLYQHAGPPLETFLAQHRALLTLRVDAFQESHRSSFEGLLDRLTPHGDRVSIIIDEPLRSLVPIDSSVFDLVLHERVD